MATKKAAEPRRTAAPAKKAATPKKAAVTAGTLKLVKDQFTKSSLTTHVATEAGVDPNK
ncbi:hypothetical protein AWB77_01480 [Caballeronia fortuita]|uniref:DNA-binding protein n=1 Tax=Caballeronia fortuita TaxID=1777138 RepID=A0A158A8G6_9BURK|nr:hypothetical protein AWB77_01480 [Caballeronia fortuita]